MGSSIQKNLKFEINMSLRGALPRGNPVESIIPRSGLLRPPIRRTRNDIT